MGIKASSRPLLTQRCGIDREADPALMCCLRAAPKARAPMDRTELAALHAALAVVLPGPTACALKSPAGSRRRRAARQRPRPAPAPGRANGRCGKCRTRPERRQQNQGGRKWRCGKCRTRLAPIADPVCRQSALRQVPALGGLRRATASNGDAGAFGRERGCVGQGRGLEPIGHRRAIAADGAARRRSRKNKPGDGN